MKRLFYIRLLIGLVSLIFILSCSDSTVSNSADIDRGSSDPVILLTIDCPEDIIVAAVASDMASATWTVPTTAVDQNGNEVAVTSTSTPTSGLDFAVGETSVSITATDDAGNADTCEFTVTVELVPLLITDCPEDVTVEAVTSDMTFATWTAPTTATDGDGNEVVVTFREPTQMPGTMFSIGMTPITYTAINEDSGLMGICEFNVIVMDAGLPVLTEGTCPEDILMEIDAGNAPVTATWEEVPMATDNSGTITLLTNTHNSGQTFPIGTTRVTYTFSDPSGNTADCVFSVKVAIILDLMDPMSDPVEGNPFLIKNANDLATLAILVNTDSAYTNANNNTFPYNTADYILTGDITFTNEFTPIGTADNRFRGTFSGMTNADGRPMYTISGLTYSGSTIEDVGLFGFVSGDRASDKAIIRNFIISNPRITNNDASRGASTGVLAGTVVRNSLVNNIASIGGAVMGVTNVGGLVGTLGITGGSLADRGGVITRTASTTSVTVINSSGGGIVGNVFEGIMVASYAAGVVMGEGNNVGGFAGIVAGGGQIIASYAIGSVTGDGSSIGGLVGASFGTITNSYARGVVTGGGRSIGGFIGLNFGVITNNSYWDSETSTRNNSAGGSNVIPYTTAQLQMPTSYDDVIAVVNVAIYEDWENVILSSGIDLDGDGTLENALSDPWDFGSSTDYPALKNNPISVDEQPRRLSSSN